MYAHGKKKCAIKYQKRKKKLPIQLNKLVKEDLKIYRYFSYIFEVVRIEIIFPARPSFHKNNLFNSLNFYLITGKYKTSQFPPAPQPCFISIQHFVEWVDRPDQP